MKLVIEINMDNAAFERHPASEVIRILGYAVGRLAFGADAPDDVKLRDINGNTVGFAHITDD